MRNLKDIITERLNITNNVICERLVLSKTSNKTPFQKICENPVYSNEVKMIPYRTLVAALNKYLSDAQPSYDLDILYDDDLPVIEYVKGSFYNVVALYLDSTKENIEFKLENGKGESQSYTCLSGSTLCSILGNGDKKCGKAAIDWIINDMLGSI